MTKDELKCKLKSAWAMQRQLENDYEELQRYRDMAMKITPAYSQTPGGNSASGQKIEAAVIKITDIEATIRKDIDRLASNLHDVDCLIGLLDDNKLRAIMRARYRNYQSWVRIAADFGYEWSHIHRLHAKALNLILQKMG